MAAPIIGFVSPPDWCDPSPSEFAGLAGGKVRTQQTILPLLNFDWQITSIAETEAAQTKAAQSLAAAGCDLIACTGTPFGWAGLTNAEEARKRSARITSATGVPYLGPGLAIVDALHAIGAKKIGLACTYYSDNWRDAWRDFIAQSGFEPHIQSLADLNLVAPHGPDDERFWAPSAALISANVKSLHNHRPNLDAIVVSGAGARTLKIANRLSQDISKPVIGADTALYWAVSRHIELDPNPIHFTQAPIRIADISA